MRFSLFDLLIASACCAVGFGVATFLADAFSHDTLAFWFGVPLVLGTYLLVTPLLYRRFRLRPLFLPRCPHCRRRPSSYRIIQSQWPCEVVACGACGGQCALLYRQGLLPDGFDVAMPRQLLAWPQSIGRWRTLPPLTNRQT